MREVAEMFGCSMREPNNAYEIQTYVTELSALVCTLPGEVASHTVQALKLVMLRTELGVI